MIKKIWSAHIWPVGRHVFNQNSLPNSALYTWDVNFFHKIYTLFDFWRNCWKNSKLVQFRAIGRHTYLFETAHIVGPQVHELANFFIKRTPFSLDFVQYIVENWANWQTHPFIHNGHHCGAPNVWFCNFRLKIDPLSICILYKKFFENFQIGSVLADWQTPLFGLNNCPNEQQSQRGLTFATQISPLLNLLVIIIIFCLSISIQLVSHFYMFYNINPIV